MVKVGFPLETRPDLRGARGSRKPFAAVLSAAISKPSGSDLEQNVPLHPSSAAAELNPLPVCALTK